MTVSTLPFLRKRVAGTGHRPERVVVGTQNAYQEAVLARVVDLCVAALRREQPDEVIAGGGLGFDLALAEAALRCGVPLALYLPFEGYDAKWPASARARYAQVRERASRVVWVTALPRDPATGAVRPVPYGVAVEYLHKRNRAMVDDCQGASDEGVLLSLWDGVPRGGTWNAVRYAVQVGCRVVPLWRSWVTHAASGLTTGGQAPGRR